MSYPYVTYEYQNSFSIEVIFSMTTKMNTPFMCPDYACFWTLNFKQL